MTTDITSPSGTGSYDADTPPWLIAPQSAQPSQSTQPSQPAQPGEPNRLESGVSTQGDEVDLSGIVPPPAAAFGPPPRPPVAPMPQPVPPAQPYAPPIQSPVPSAPRPSAPGPSGHRAGPALDEVALIRKARRPPVRGWRRAVHTLSGGTVNPGESAAELDYRDLLERVRQPVRGDYRIAVLSLKGGVGKTTTTIGLGSTFASLRGDRVIAVDANPDLGTLAQRVPLQTQSTVRDLLADPVVARYSDVRAHTSQAPSRLEVLASERDPAAAEAFDENEYRGVMSILQRFYNIILTDCGTGMSHSAMRGVLDLADAIVLVSSPALDGARSAGATLDWLAGHGFGHLIARSVVVLSSARPGASSIDMGDLTQHFLTRCRAVHEISFDDHLAEGADIDLDLLGKHARRSFVELAATIADDFGGTVLRRHPPFEG
ncbi:AAA family ATPase [Gordonia sp. HY002]|uniref:MinD/ParA family ATP-binding protein n=1 Tax=Gordonia zhenghanii TaxID=2911516 RepID=UPI001EF07C7B|nr:AAA family ATPase [Gordonia zhenghanii]MCF8606090.1 AAA family ATPase [Gordonia zhenghanii]